MPEKIGQLTMLASGSVVTGPGGPVDLETAVGEGRAGSVLNVWGTNKTQPLQQIARARHGIPLLFGLDVLHGFETIFPIPLGEASAFDDDLWEATARAAAAEAARAGIHLTFAPMLDVTREPRWGRVAESPGEDQSLAIRFAKAKTRGFQGQRLGAPGAIAATAKHLAAYGAPAAGREYASADVSERSLLEVFLPPFRAAVEAGVAAIMPAFNDIAGMPMSANRAILRDVVRRKWGFCGVMISDYNAVIELIKHGVAPDLADAARLALRAGIDIEMMGGAYELGLPIALGRDPSLIEDLDSAVERVLCLKEQLGLLHEERPIEVRDDLAQRRNLARTAAARSAVLLANRDLLPLDPSIGRIAVVGPLADAPKEMLGSWAAAGTAADAVSILDGLKAALPECEIDFARGCEIAGTDLSGIDVAVQLARSAEVVLLCVGEAADMSGEAASRSDLGLPGGQSALARAVIGSGKPAVVILSSGRPIVAPWLFEAADAVLVTWFLGSEAGHAIADLITGRSEPVGRLPITWPRSVGQIPIFHSERPTGRPADPKDKFTSKYLDTPNEPQFVFGHGLSYANFAYENLCVPTAPLTVGEPVTVTVNVTNVGSRDGEETVLVFVHDLIASIAQPGLLFKASKKVALRPGETKSVAIALPAATFEFIGPDMTPIVEPGEFEIHVGPRADLSVLLTARIRLVAKR